MTDLDASIDAALVHLDRAATEAALHDDPLQAPFTALARLRGFDPEKSDIITDSI